MVHTQPYPLPLALMLWGRGRAAPWRGQKTRWCVNASEEREMKQSSRWNLPRGRRPGGAAGLVALG